MNILTDCEANMYFKAFLKRTILLPPTQFEWGSTYENCDRYACKEINKAILLLNKYRFHTYCRMTPTKPFWELCDVAVVVYIPAGRTKWWENGGQEIYQRLLAPVYCN